MKASNRKTLKGLVLAVGFAGLAAVAIAATLVITTDSGGAKSAGPVPRLPAETDSPASATAVLGGARPTTRVGFIGLPPEGTAPSTPERGELVVELGGRSTVDGGPLNSALVYADGRLIWRKEGGFSYGANPSTTGFLEQHLTPEGVERMRSEILATGLFDRDLGFRSSVAIWGWARVRRGDRLVSVCWNLPGNPPDPSCSGAIPTSEQERALRRLDELLLHPRTWLPASAWADTTIRPFVPARFAICYGPNWRGTRSPKPIGPARILALLPRSAQDLLSTRDRRAHPDAASGLWFGAPEIYCNVVTTAEAHILAEAFDRAGYVRNNPDEHWVLEFLLDAPAPLNRVGIVFEPIFPHGVWGCTDCG